MIIVRCSYAPKGGSKTQNGGFSSEIALCLKKVCYKVSLCGNCQRQSCMAFIGLTIHAKMIGGGATPSTWNFGSKWPRWSEIAAFRFIFARSVSAVTPSGKCSINTNRKSTTCFPLSLRWSSYVAPKPSKGDSKRKTAVFGLKSHFAWRKSAAKFLYVKTVSDKVVWHSLA